MDIRFPPEKRTRLIVNTDAKNEADDQFAIVHALLSPSLEIHGVIPAHYGTRKTPTSMQESRDEVDLLLRLMGWTDRVEVANGAPHALPDVATPVPSPGAELIIREAMRVDDRPLHVAFFGPLTDMASAILMEPAIQDRKVRVIWIGGGRWPVGGNEYNLSNDIHSANVVMRSSIETWMIPVPVFWQMAVGYAELLERVYPMGELGKYLVEQLIDWNARSTGRAMEYRSLGDSPAVGVVLYPECGRYSMQPAPEFDDEMKYVHTGGNRPIRVYETIDSRFVLEDFFHKLVRFSRNESIPEEVQRAAEGRGLPSGRWG
jgi:purine nucleosidase